MSRFVVLLVLAAPAAGCWFLAPAQVGGSTSYAVTLSGNMQPDVGEREGYRVGDVVAYRNEPPGKVDLRRIVGTDGDRYVVRGDADVQADGYHPTEQEVLGTPWPEVPWVAAGLSWLGSPVALTIALGTLLVFLVDARRHGSWRDLPPITTPGSRRRT